MKLRSSKLSKTNSFFLFGPRGCGKTTLLKSQFSEKSLYLDLLDPEIYDQLIFDIKRFSQLIHQPESKNKTVVIDEIQKIPRLLDIIHSEIQKTKRQFIMTGSSSRKLKQSGTNLLAGRAWVYELFPFSSLEILGFEQNENLDLQKCLMWGGLPEVYDYSDQSSIKEYLNSYAGTYLQKEIQEERWVKNLEPFRKFLAIAAQMNGRIINKLKISQEIGVTDSTIAHYFEILEDTLLGFSLPAYHNSVRKAQKLSPKFYFIDTGIKRALERTLSVEILPQTFAWGDAFEHWVILEFKKNISYARLDWEMSYLQTKDGVEIDLIIDRPGQTKLLVEIKSKDRVTEADAKALETLGQDVDSSADRWLLSNDQLEQKFGTTRAIHWLKAIKELFEPSLG